MDLGKQQKLARVLRPQRDLNELWLQTDPVLVVIAIWGTKQHTDRLIISL